MKMIDLIAVALILLCAVRGGYRGFWLTMARIFGVLAAALISWSLHPTLKAWLRNEPELITGFQKKLLGPFLEALPADSAQGLLLKLADVLNSSEFPVFIKHMILASEPSPEGTLVTLNETTLSLLSFIILLAGTILIIQVGTLLLDRVFKLPGLGLLNRSVGTALGMLEGIGLVWIALAVLTPWIAFRPEGLLAKAIRDSQVTGWLYQHNYLLGLIDFTLK